MNDIAACFAATREVIAHYFRATILTLFPRAEVPSGYHEFKANLEVHRMPHLCNARFSIASTALFAATIGAAILLPAASAQTLSTSDSALNTGTAASTSYNAPGTGGTNTPVVLATNSSKNLWLMYNNPWGINSGSGTMTQTYSGSGSLTTAIDLTGLPGGGVDAYPFVLYGCDPWMDCYQGQPPQFPKQLSAMSSLSVEHQVCNDGHHHRKRHRSAFR